MAVVDFNRKLCYPVYMVVVSDIYKEFKVLLKFSTNAWGLSEHRKARGYITCNLCGDTTVNYYKSRATECKKCSNSRHKKYVKNNKKKVYSYTYCKMAEYRKQKCKKDPVYKQIIKTKVKIHQRFAGYYGKPTDYILELGCTIEEYKLYLENLFLPGMSWENYGRNKNCWSIDHIIPLSSAKTIKQAVKLFHYKNTQPLWQIDNIKKSNKIK